MSQLLGLILAMAGYNQANMWTNVRSLKNDGGLHEFDALRSEVNGAEKTGFM